MSPESDLGASPPLPQKSPGFDTEALTRALRIAGAVLVVASASTFMLQNWQGGGDLWKYALLVGQSLLLAATAYFVGITVRESRSARTLLALVLGTIPVCFTVLGALVYSRFHIEVLSELPQYANWVAPNDLSVLLAGLGTAVVLVPLGIAAFVALARQEARLLTGVFFASNALLLLPSRTPEVMVALAGALSIGLLHLDLSRFSRAAQLDTLEGRLARAMPFAPLAIVLSRAVHLYPVRAPFIGGVFLVLAALLFQSLPRFERAGYRDLGSMISAIAAQIGWALCGFELVRHIEGASLGLLVLGLPASVLLFLSSLRAARLKKALVSLGTLVGLGTTLAACVAGLNTASALVCTLCGTLVLVGGAGVRSRLWMILGSTVALFGVATEVWLAVQADNFLRWASLSIAGVLLIVGSAYVERNRVRVSQAWERLRHKTGVPAVGAE